MATKPDDTADAFDDAFAQFATRKDVDDATPGGDAATDEDKKDDPDGGTGTDTTVDADADATAGGDAAGGDDGTGADDKGEGDGDDDVSQPNTDPDDVLQRLSALLKDAPAKDEVSKDFVDPNAPKEETLPELYTEEEKTFLKTYDEDWGDVTKGEALKRRAEYRELMTHVFNEVSKHVMPLAEMVTELATRTHLGDLQERVPDYNELRDNVVEWVETQPAYLQVGMKEVMKTGTADEVADLINRYRKDKGIADPSASPEPKQKVELSDDAKKAAKALAPVDTKRSVIPQDDGLDDFDSAFAKFAGKSK